MNCTTDSSIGRLPPQKTGHLVLGRYSVIILGVGKIGDNAFGNVVLICLNLERRGTVGSQIFGEQFVVFPAAFGVLKWAEIEILASYVGNALPTRFVEAVRG